MPRAGRVQATDEARSYGRRASLLSIGVGITGLITYLYFAIASHELSREQYGQVAVLWSAVFIVVSVLQRPVEQLLSRTISREPGPRHADRAARCGWPRRSSSRVAVDFDVVALALRTPIQDHLLHGNSTLYWIGVAADHRLRGELLRPRLPRRQPPADDLRAPDHLRVGLADGVPVRRRPRHRLAARRRSRWASSPPRRSR